MRAWRACSFALVASALTLALTTPVTAATEIDGLLVAGVPGYQSNTAGDDGPVDLSDESLVGLRAALEKLRDRLFQRSFRSDDGTRLGFLIAAPTTHDDLGRTGFVRDFAKSAKDLGLTPFVTPLTSKAVVTYEGNVDTEDGSMPVAYAAYGATATGYILFAFGPEPRRTLVDLLGPQLAFVPASEPSDEGDLVAYRIGERLGQLLLIALPVGIWLAVRASRKKARAAGPPVFLFSPMRERIAGAPLVEPYRRATRERTYDAIVARHAILQGDRPPTAAVQKHLDAIINEFANGASGSDWLRIGASEGWRLGRAVLGMHAQSYVYESRKRLPQDRLDALQASYARLAQPGLPKATSAGLRDSVDHTAGALATYQPTAADHEHTRSDYRALVWRGVALAFAEFDTFHEWTPPAARPKRVTSV